MNALVIETEPMGGSLRELSGFAYVDVGLADVDVDRVVLNRLSGRSRFRCCSYVDMSLVAESSLVRGQIGEGHGMTVFDADALDTCSPCVCRVFSKGRDGYPGG